MKKTKSIQVPIYIPKTINQEEYVKHLNNDDTKIIISTGPAGCGKTLFACQKAVIDLKSEKVNKIIITRPVVSVDEEIGFLPGNLIKKMDPWTKPIFDIVLEYYSKGELDLLLMNGKIEICPLAFMRGRTFKNSFIIADEMQNSSPNQMMMLTTRIGTGSKMVITGDLKQTDKNNVVSGLYDITKKFKKYEKEQSIKHNNSLINHEIKIIEFNNTDIERDPVISKILDIYDVDTKIDNIIDNDCAIIPKHLYRGYGIL
jgi:phosphate starvation-inducible PhoH-like protein